MQQVSYNLLPIRLHPRIPVCVSLMQCCFRAPRAPGFPLITVLKTTHYYPNFAKPRNEIPPSLGIVKCMWLIRN